MGVTRVDRTTDSQPGKRRRGGSRSARNLAPCLFFVLAPFVLAVTLLVVSTPGIARAEDPVIPQYGSDKHEGVSSCDGSGCHGSAAPRNDRNVMQNEYSIWADEDRHHTRAYKILLNKDSQRISKNLGREQKPHQDDLCLDCHADNPPPAQRRTENNSFRIEDGVGCEGCHGGAERYLKSHDSGSSHSKNIALGLYPTDQPVARARLCLSCHFGDRKKFVDHRLMGAGHPRQSFELSLFSILQPYHWEPDADYLERGKQAPSDVKLWAIGQAVAVDEFLDAMLDPKRNRLGLFPEFVLYDCHACHHPIDKQRRWSPRATTGLGPGVARLNDANFLMLMQAAQLVDAAAATALRNDLRALHQAASEGRGDAEATAGRIRASIATLLPKLEAWEIDKAALRKLAKSLLETAASGGYKDYSASEQAAMAIQGVLYGYLLEGLLDEAAYDALERGELARLLDAVEDPDNFKSAQAQKSFQQIKAKISAR